MNSLKLQDINQHKKLVVFLYTHTKQAEKDIKDIYNYLWKNKTLRNKFKQGGIRAVHWKH